uniref:DEUBAD domain-containing protein n=1 Tax=Gossypium raimondii TaxID=29730 RepID=A0A0D2VK30_GOSRA|nr:hypothetical protein B456_011G088500 [Gossypium raimondii]KJB70714.1 hypothetical protein B456_011G088500 [Gossypium raimondii]KJB70715.1 hypothetical protein B456_011G088500 [Gossypium raimondii]
MAADRQRKRLNGASIAGCNFKDQYRTKKKKLDSLQNDLNTKSCISLEWDGNQKKVVAKRDQIGLSWRHLRPFTDSTIHYHRVLADVLTLPHEIFDLENLTEVLSYEVWQTLLSENERNHLMQFLPTGTDKEHVLQALLAGDNFHFGNPFLKWGSLLCLGYLHPDAVIQEEQHLKDEKKAYYSQLQDYHNDIIDYLQKLKVKWESCKDPEQEIVHKFWRSRRASEKGIFSHSNESKLVNLEQDATGTSESCSWAADERACSSDNQNSSVVKGGELQRRMYKKGFIKDKGKGLLTAPDHTQTVEAKPRKGDKIRKCNIQQSNGAKYMSYVKISKKQHELIKNMRQSGRSIQYRSLNHVLGDIDSLHVLPYDTFVEEEMRNLHEHWLRLVKEDLQEAYASRREIQLQKREIAKLLEQNIEEKLNPAFEDEVEEDTEKFHDQEDNVGIKLDVQDVEKEIPEKLLEGQKDAEATDRESSMEEESVLALPQNQSPQQVSSIDSGNMLNCEEIESENKENLLKSDIAFSDLSERSKNLKTADATVNQEVHVSSTENVWSAYSMPQSYHDSTEGHDYTSCSGLPLAHQANADRQNHMIDLESGLHEESTGKVLLHGHSEDGSFSSYTNQDQSELLPSFFKDQVVLPYHSEQKHDGLDFQAPKNVLMEDGDFNGQFQGQLRPSLPLEEGQKRQDEVFVQQNMSGNVYSDGSRGRYLPPRQEHLPSGNMQDWGMNPAHMSAPFQHQLNGGQLLNQSWFTGEHQAEAGGGWAGSDGFSGPSESIAISRESNTDQSLFSVVSQCNQLGSRNPYRSMGSTEHLIQQRSNGINENSMEQAGGHPLDYLGVRDASMMVMGDEMGRMSMAHQNAVAALHDDQLAMGKPYLRSWNQQR